MPYTVEHKQRSRRRILQSAYKLFSTRGYDNVSINEIMAEADMTRGGFYAHFDNKSVLYYEAIKHAAETSIIARRKPDEIDDKSWLENLLEQYLHKKHLRGHSWCPLASLASDVAVRDARVRKAYTRSFKGMHDMMTGYSKSFSACTQDTVMAVTAMVIGGLAIARALDDTALSEKLLDNCKKTAMELLDTRT